MIAQEPAPPAAPAPSGRGPLRNAARIVPWLLLLVGVTLSVGLWQQQQQSASQAAVQRFEVQSGQTVNFLFDRLTTYEHLLRAAQGLFVAHASVNRAQWHAFITTLGVDEADQRDVNGVGFIAAVPAAQLQPFLAQTRADDDPGFALAPPGERAQYFPVVMAEPAQRLPAALAPGS